jgi:hypothetical protein
VREGSVSLLGFLSHFFGDDFSSCYDVTIQAVLDACADTNGAIRTVGLRSASLITKTFSRTRPDLILAPFFGCAVEESWRHRLCAVNFVTSFPSRRLTRLKPTGGPRGLQTRLARASMRASTVTSAPALLALFILAADPFRPPRSK